jgi:ABC-type nitrate/sulfonate/bicarbonate transport system substrate-binding protein
MQPEKSVTFRVGIAAPTINMLPLWLGQEAGLFADRGFAVEIIDMAGGSHGLVALAKGELEAHNVGLSAVVAANSAGTDLRLIAASANSMQFGFFTTKNIHTAADLVGRKVGVSAFASESDVAASLALKRLGLSRSKVEMVEAGATPRRLEALLRGELDATPLNAPTDFAAAAAGVPKLLDLAADVPWIFNGLIVTRAALAAHRDVFRRFLMAYIEAADLGLADETRVKDVLATRFAANSREVISASAAEFRRTMPSDARPSHRGAQNVLAELPQLGTQVTSNVVADHVDASLVDELEASGFIAALKRKYSLP